MNKFEIIILSSIISFAGCRHSTSPSSSTDQSLSPLEGSWRTIGIYTENNWDGYISTYSFHNNIVYISSDAYTHHHPDYWSSNHTTDTYCRQFILDRDFILLTDTSGYFWMPNHYAIDNSILTLTHGYIFNGTSDSLLTSIWSFEYLDHYNGSVPAIILLTLTFNTDTTGKLSFASTASAFKDTLAIQYQASNKLLRIIWDSIFQGASDDSAQCEVVNKKLYLNFINNAQQLRHL